MTKKAATASQFQRIYYRSQYRFFLKTVALIAFIIVALSSILKQFITLGTFQLFTTSIDPIVADFGTATGGAVLGTALVGLLIDDYHTKYGRNQESYSALLNREGFVDVYANANDPNLLSALDTAIDQAHDKIVALGLGLGILHNNRHLLEKIARRMNSSKHLKVTIITGSSENIGVQNRISEEEAWHKISKVNYDPDWVHKFPSEIDSVLHLLVDPNNHKNLKTYTVDSCTMLGLIRIDETVFYFPYGSPNIRGAESPWIHFTRPPSGGAYWMMFFDKVTQYYENLQKTNDISQSGDKQE